MDEEEEWRMTKCEKEEEKWEWVMKKEEKLVESAALPSK